MADILQVFKTVYDTVGEIAYLKAATAVDNTNKYMKQSTDQLNASQVMLDAKLHTAEAAFMRQSAAVQKNQEALAANQATIRNYSEEVAKATNRAAQFGREAELAAKAGMPINAGIALGNQSKEQNYISQLNDAIKKQNVTLQENQIKFAQSTAKVKEAAAVQEDLKVKMEQANKVMEARAKEKGDMGFFDQLKARIGKTFSSLEQFGKDFDSATKTAHRAANATEKFLNIFDRLSIAVRGKPIFDYDKSVQKATDSTAMLSQNMDLLSVATVGITNPALGATMAATMLGQVLGQVLTQGIQMAISGFINMAQASVRVVAGFESQIMTLRSMVAMENMAKDSKLNFADATTQATEMTIELNAWMERLGIASRYTTQDVKGILTYYKQFGFAVGEAARLTKATMDWGTATGKEGYQLQNVALALGQVRAAGKLMGGEMMQLRNAGFDMGAVYRELAKSLGKTEEQVRALGNEGITAQQFLTAAVAAMESTNGAAKQAAGSFNGLLSSISEVGPLFLREFFGPMDTATGKVQGLLGAIQPYLAKLVDILLSPELMGAIRGFGIQLGVMADSAFAWGENIVLQLAQGMAAAVGAVLDVLMVIGSSIAYWLMPGSPPKILPDIDKWGAGTMQAWLDGFKQVNANSIFLSLGDSIDRFMRSQGGKKDANLIPQIMGGQDTVRQAVEEFSHFGQVTQKTLDAIGLAAGENGALFQEFVGNYFKVQAATLQFQKVQEEAAKVAGEYDKRLQGIKDRIDGINSARIERDEQKQIHKLQRILNDPRASAKRRKKAQEDLDLIMLTREQRSVEKDKNSALLEAQKKVEAAEKELMLAQERLMLTEQMMQALDKQNTLLEQQAQLLERLAKENEPKKETGGAGSKGQPSGTPISIGGFDFGGGKDALGGESLFDRISKQIGLDKLQTKWDAFTGSLSKIWTGIQPFIGPTQGFLDRIGKIFGNVNKEFLTFWEKNKGVLSEVGIMLPTAQQTFDLATGVIESFSQAIFILVNTSLNLLQEFIDWVKESWPGWEETFTETTKNASNSLDEFSDVASILGDIFESLRKIAQQAIKGIVQVVKSQLDVFMVNVKTFADILGLDWDKMWAAVETVTKRAVKLVEDYISGGMANIKIALQIVSDVLKGDWKRAWEDTKRLIEQTGTTITTVFNDLKATILAVFSIIADWVVGRAEYMKTESLRHFENFKSEATGKFNEIKDRVVDHFNSMKDNVVNTAENLKTLAFAKFQQLKDLLLNPSSINWGAIGTTIIQRIINAFMNAVTGVGGLLDTATWAMEQLAAIFTWPPIGPLAPRMNMPSTSFGSGTIGGQTLINYNYNLGGVTTRQSVGSIVADFAILEVMAG